MLSPDELHRFQERKKYPHSYAQQDIIKLHDLKMDSVERKAFNFYCAASGRLKTIKRIFSKPNIDRETYPLTVEAFILDDKNLPWLQRLYDQYASLRMMYQASDNEVLQALDSRASQT